MFKVYALTALVFAAAWIAAWFAFIRPLLKRYALTTGLIARLDAAEGGLWARIKLWAEGKKTLALAFLTSALAAGKAATDQATAVVANLSPDALQPLQDKGLWSAFLNDVWTLHIVAALGLLTAFMTLKGKVQAAQIAPKA